MNILMVAGPGISLKEPYSSGIEAFIVSTAKQLVRKGHIVDVIAQDADSTAPFTIINPFWGPKGIKNRFQVKRRQAQQFSQLDTSKYDVIHYNMFYPHLYRASAQFSAPAILTLHSPATSKRIRVYRRFARQSNVQFVAISDRIKQEYSFRIGQDIPVIDNGIDISQWPLRSQTDGEYLLWSARINKEKNPAAAISLAHHTNQPLIIAGRIADQGYFDKHVKPFLSHTIQYVGHLTQQQVSQLTQRASAYLATATWQEPFGLAALEMLASGVPVVGFGTAIPPTWQHSSVSTATSTDWHDLIKPLEHVRSATPQQCRSFAANMSVEKMTANYCELYYRLAIANTFIELSQHSNVPYGKNSIPQLLTQPQVIE